MGKDSCLGLRMRVNRRQGWCFWCCGKPKPQGPQARECSEDCSWVSPAFPTTKAEVFLLARAGRGEDKRLSKGGLSKDPGQFGEGHNTPPWPVPQPSAALKPELGGERSAAASSTREEKPLLSHLIAAASCTLTPPCAPVVVLLWYDGTLWTRSQTLSSRFLQGALFQSLAFAEE